MSATKTTKKAAPRVRRQPPPPGLVKISRLAQLSEVPASTIKHYVRMGLLPPPVTRPNRQMAYYDEGLVDRIRAIKILQTERFLPLPTIKRILGEPPKPGEKRGETLKAQQLAALEPALRPEPTGWLSRQEVLSSFQVSERDLTLLDRARLLRVTPGADGTPGYADTDLEILRVIHETRAAGLDALFPMEILEPYVGAVRQLVRLEIDLFRHRLQTVDNLPTGASLTEVATMASRLGERLVVALRRQLVLSELRDAQEVTGVAPARNGNSGATAAAPRPRAQRAQRKPRS